MGTAGSYNQTLDTMVATALDTYSRDPINALTDGGEKFMKTAAQKGRVFLVNDAEAVRHPIMHAHGEATSLYKADQLDGTPSAANNLSATASDILTFALFDLPAATRNINFPQSQPPGNLIDFVASQMKATMTSLINQEELLFTQGTTGESSTTQTQRDPFSADGDNTAGIPMSLASIFLQSSATSNEASATSTAKSWGNVKTDNIAKWQPTHVTSGQVNLSDIYTDIQSAILNASYSEEERPTDLYTTLLAFEGILSKLRADAALPDPVRANMGKEGTIPFGGINIDWSRYLLKDVIFDTSATYATTATTPLLGVNWNSLRYNVVRQGGIMSDSSLGFIRKIGDVLPHPTKTNLFQRIEFKRCWSCDKGRRSFFMINGITSDVIA